MADWAPGSPLSRQLRDDVQAAKSIFGPGGVAEDPERFDQLKSEAADRYLAAKKARLEEEEAEEAEEEAVIVCLLFPLFEKEKPQKESPRSP